MKKTVVFPFVAALFLLLLTPAKSPYGKSPLAGGNAPSAPTGLAASLVYPHHVLLNWNANTESDIAGYNVYRSASLRNGYGRINLSAVSGISFVDTGVSVGSTCYYKVSAVNTAGTEGKSSAAVPIAVAEVPDTVAPQPPAGFRAQGGFAQVALSWVNPSDNDFSGTTVRFALAGYPSGPGDGLLVCDRTSAPGSPDTFLHAGLENGRTYYYTAFSHDGAGNYSTGANAAAAPVDNAGPVIAGVREEQVTATGATIRWSTDEPSDSQVEYGESAGYGSTTPPVTTMTTDHSVPLAGLTPATLYHYRVISVDASGNRSTSGDRTFSTAPLAEIACADCHGPLPQYDHFVSSGHGKAGIALSCETCHTSGHEHTSAYKELKAVGGYFYPDLSTAGLENTTDARKFYCLFACHAALPASSHPNGYDYVARAFQWKYIEILSPEESMQKYGYYLGTILPASEEVRLLDVDGNGIDSYGDIVMCATCHDVHGTQTGYYMTPIITGQDNVNALCIQCHTF